MEICKQKNFCDQISSPWKSHRTFDEILHYKSFSLPSFSTTNQTGVKHQNKDHLCNQNDGSRVPKLFFFLINMSPQTEIIVFEVIIFLEIQRNNKY